MNKYLLLALIGSLLTSLSQVLLKYGAVFTKNKPLLFSFFNLFTFSGYFIFVIVILINLIAFQNLEMKIVPVILAANFVFLMLLSRLILKEKITSGNMISIFFIFIGVTIFNWN